MTLPQKARQVSTIALAICLTACGGGGSGGQIASTPPPPPVVATSTPTPTAVEIFEAPATQEFTALTSNGPGDPLRIRYDAATGKYEVMAPGRGWDALIDDPSFSPHAGDPNTSFRFASSGGSNPSYFLIRASHRFSEPTVQYRYSNLAAWGVQTSAPGGGQAVGGYTAFGMATPTTGVPLSGTGNYHGLVEGSSTIPWHWDDETFAAPVGGVVALRFDFGSGSLVGEMRPYVEGDNGRVSLGTFAFADTVHGIGNQSFSGRFVTSASGSNAFSGLFTGPAAQELIGKWALPFVYPVDGSTQSASGAWIAKRN